MIEIKPGMYFRYKLPPDTSFFKKELDLFDIGIILEKTGCSTSDAEEHERWMVFFPNAINLPKQRFYYSFMIRDAFDSFE